MLSSTSKPIGFYRSKTESFLAYKDSIRQAQKRNRFSKDKMIKTSVQNNTFSQKSESKNNLESPLIKDKRTDETAITIEIRQHELPPPWVDLQESAIAKLRRTESIQDEIAQKCRERMKRGFGDNSTIDAEIYTLTKTSNQLIREAEQKMQAIDEMATYKSESNSEKASNQLFPDQPDSISINVNLVRRNVRQSLAQQIQEATIRLRKQQKAIYDAMKNHSTNSGNDYSNSFNLATPVEESTQSTQSSMQMQDSIFEEVVKGREKNINLLVDQINELSDIYKTLGVLVIDQGTMLDRIDANIIETKDNVLKSNKALKSAVQKQESPFATKVTKFLIGFIFLFSVLLVLKHSA